MNSDRIRELGLLKLLYSIEGIGPQKIFSLLAKFHSFENIFSASYSSLLNIEGINKTLANKITSSSFSHHDALEKLKKELASLERINAKLISFWDDEYPSALRNIYFPPLFLYVKGNFDTMMLDSVAIVGTREPSTYGKLMAEKFSTELVRKDLVIVSGLARGIDSISHSAAIKASGKTVAVIGSGLDIIYPPENKKLFELIVENGCVISEYELGTKPDAQNFPRRNRIISGLSLGTLLIETRLNGGAMQTAAYALDQGREVFAVPGALYSKQSEGPHSLIQKGEAKLVTSADDIVNELPLRKSLTDKKKANPVYVELNLFEEKLYNILSDDPKQIDEIAIQTSMNTSDCLVHLLTLEFKGLVKQLPGKIFIRS